MNFDQFRRRADAVRQIPLEAVLAFRGAVRDRHDRAKWHTERGPLSVTASQFTAWHTDQGGGGAIDLVMHLAQVDVGTAVQWLEHLPAGGHGHRAASPLAVGQLAPSVSGRPPPLPQGRGPLRLPIPYDRHLDRVRRYLKERRGLSGSVLEPLIQSGKLYADRRANAVFLLVTGKRNRPVGAELRGTGPRVWRGMAPGTRKDLGFFWLGVPAAQHIVLCESAIDAISHSQMHPDWLCLSTSGVRANPAWLPGLLARGYQIHCGFDADRPGDAAAARMITLHPAVQRRRPSAHDWNDLLTSRRQTDRNARSLSIPEPPIPPAQLHLPSVP
jgi:hypothetical protein